ncbi:aminoglycoside phosphotransferase [Yinghuangia aomiensis]
MERTAWADLPDALKDAIEARTGRITEARMVTAGENSPLAAIVQTDDGATFVKGIPVDHRRVITQDREAAVAPYVREISPELRWQFDEAGWNVLGYAAVEGRHADYRPDSPDLDALVTMMTALGEIAVADHPLFKRADDRWKTYLDDPEAAVVLAGPTLLHSDWTPDNVIVSPDQAWLIDWAWPTLGAAWIDPACWTLRLMAVGGHTAKEAEYQASRIPAFAAADPDHLDLFASANVRVWAEVAQANPTQWTNDMAEAAREWSRHRQAHKHAAPADPR